MNPLNEIQKSQTKNLLIIALALIILLMTCNNKRNGHVILPQNTNTFTERKNQDGSVTTSQRQLIMSMSDAIRNNALQLEELKKIASQVHVRTETEIKEVEVPSPYPVEVLKIDTLNYLRMPAKFSTNKNGWFSLNTTLHKVGEDSAALTIDSLKVWNEYYVTVGYKTHFFKKDEPLVEVKNLNPYTSVTDMNNIVIKEKKGVFQKRGFWMALGSAITIGAISLGRK